MTEKASGSNGEGVGAKQHRNHAAGVTLGVGQWCEKPRLSNIAASRLMFDSSSGASKDGGFGQV